ncbi:hypothetical protein CLV73_1537 [Chryseobacterium geocarposphaerae]|uniref:Uncharacterized protein n=1 Tax=Chryseobacterium geocarposphaerae TaxID=1416776 RepID=A0A2M9C9Q5_9FLAO|nr:hypothetical protein CLV73_1537 [Chryseobacterium geocarposphaerae]
MEVQFFYTPKRNFKKYIEGYYFISEKDPPKSNKYWAFPSNNCIVTVCQNANIVSENNKIRIIPSGCKII